MGWSGSACPASLEQSTQRDARVENERQRAPDSAAEGAVHTVADRDRKLQLVQRMLPKRDVLEDDIACDQLARNAQDDRSLSERLGREGRERDGWERDGWERDGIEGRERVGWERDGRGGWARNRREGRERDGWERATDVQHSLEQALPLSPSLIGVH